MLKVLNLYAGIGGNRKLWKDVQVTAVEIDANIATEYQKNFPDDKVVVADAKEFLLAHFKEFDFIWASPPCPTHSRFRTLLQGEGKIGNKSFGSSYVLPDMDLYSIIIFLKHFYDGVWVVENTISYYEPLIKPYVVSNHYVWSNKIITEKKAISRNITNQDLILKSKERGMNIPDCDVSMREKRKMLNNCVMPETGLHIWNCCFKEQQKKLMSMDLSLKDVKQNAETTTNTE